LRTGLYGSTTPLRPRRSTHSKDIHAWIGSPLVLAGVDDRIEAPDIRLDDLLSICFPCTITFCTSKPTLAADHSESAASLAA
jgi:hypothetical protein